MCPSLSLYYEKSLCDAAFNGDLFVIKSVLSVYSVLVNSIDKVSTCHSYNNYRHIEIV